MQVAKDEIIVVYHSAHNKRVLGRVIKMEDDDVHFMIADESAGWDSTREHGIAPLTSVHCNLGLTPRCYGSAYGVNINPFEEKTHVKGWGDVLWMLGTTDDIVNTNEKFLKQMAQYAKEDRIHPIPTYTVIQELELRRTAAFVMRGNYKFQPRKEADRIMYNLCDNIPLDLHLVAHEFGHGCWHRLMSDKVRGQWVDAYATSIEVAHSGGNQVLSVLSDLASLQGRDAIRTLVKDYKAEQAGDLLSVLTIVFDIIEDEHYLQVRELDSLISGGYSIKKYLPTVSEVKRGIPKVLVSDYAKKNAFELWAEAFGFFYADKELPDFITNLMEDTLVTLQSPR